MSVVQSVTTKAAEDAGLNVEPMLNTITPTKSEASPAVAPPISFGDPVTQLPASTPQTAPNTPTLDSLTGGSFQALDISNSPALPEIGNVFGEPAPTPEGVDPLTGKPFTTPYIPQLPSGEVPTEFIPEQLYEGSLSRSQYDYERFTRENEEQARKQEQEIRKYRSNTLPTNAFPASGITGPPGAVRYGKNSRISTGHNIPTLWDQGRESPGDTFMSGLFRGFEIPFGALQDQLRIASTFVVMADALVRGDSSWAGTRNPIRAGQDFINNTGSTYLSDYGNEFLARSPIAHTLSGLLGNQRNYLSFDESDANPFRDFLLNPDLNLKDRELRSAEEIVASGDSLWISNKLRGLGSLYESIGTLGGRVDRRVTSRTPLQIPRIQGSVYTGLGNRIDEVYNNPGIAWRIAGSAALDVILDPLNAFDFGSAPVRKVAVDAIDTAAETVSRAVGDVSVPARVSGTTQYRSIPKSSYPSAGPRILYNPPGSITRSTSDPFNILGPRPIFIDVPTQTTSQAASPRVRTQPPRKSGPVIYLGPAEPVAAVNRPDVINLGPALGVSRPDVINLGPAEPIAAVDRPSTIRLGPASQEPSITPLLDFDSFRILRPDADATSVQQVLDATLAENAAARPILEWPGYTPDDLRYNKSPISQLYRWDLQDTNLAVQQQLDGTIQVVVKETTSSLIKSSELGYMPVGQRSAPPVILDLLVSTYTSRPTYTQLRLRSLAEEATSPPITAIVRLEDVPQRTTSAQARQRYRELDAVGEPIHPSYGDAVPSSPLNWVKSEIPNQVALTVDEVVKPVQIELAYQTLMSEVSDVAVNLKNRATSIDYSTSVLFDQNAVDEYGYQNVLDVMKRDQLPEVIREADRLDETIANLETINKNVRESGRLSPLSDEIDITPNGPTEIEELITELYDHLGELDIKYPDGFPSHIEDATRVVESMLDNYEAYRPADIAESIKKLKAGDYDAIGRNVDSQAQNLAQLEDEARELAGKLADEIKSKADELDSKTYKAEADNAQARKQAAIEAKSQQMQEVQELTKKADPNETTACFIPKGGGSASVSSTPQQEKQAPLQGKPAPQQKWSDMKWGDLRKEAKARGIKLQSTAKRADYEAALSTYKPGNVPVQQPSSPPSKATTSSPNAPKTLEEMNWNEIRAEAKRQGIKMPPKSTKDMYLKRLQQERDKTSTVKPTKSTAPTASTTVKPTTAKPAVVAPEVVPAPEPLSTARVEQPTSVGQSAEDIPPIVPNLEAIKPVAPSAKEFTFENFKAAQNVEERAALIKRGRQSIPENANQELWNQYYTELISPKPTFDNRERVKKLMHKLSKEGKKGLPVPDFRALEDAYGVRYNAADFDEGPTSKAFQQTIDTSYREEQSTGKDYSLVIGDRDWGAVSTTSATERSRNAELRGWANEYPGSLVELVQGENIYSEYTSPFTLLSEHELRKMAQRHGIDPYASKADLIDELDAMWQDDELKVDLPRPDRATEKDVWLSRYFGNKTDDGVLYSQSPIITTKDTNPFGGVISPTSDNGVYQKTSDITGLTLQESEQVWADLRDFYDYLTLNDTPEMQRFLDTAPTYGGQLYSLANSVDLIDLSTEILTYKNNISGYGFGTDTVTVFGATPDQVNIYKEYTAPSGDGYSISLAPLKDSGYTPFLVKPDDYAIKSVYADGNNIFFEYYPSSTPLLSDADINAQVNKAVKEVTDYINSSKQGATTQGTTVQSSIIDQQELNFLTLSVNNAVPSLTNDVAGQAAKELGEFVYKYDGYAAYPTQDIPRLDVSVPGVADYLKNALQPADTIYYGFSVPKNELPQFLAQLKNDHLRIAEHRVTSTNMITAYDYAIARDKEVPIIVEFNKNKSTVVSPYTPGNRNLTITKPSSYRIDTAHYETGVGGLYLTVSEVNPAKTLIPYTGYIPADELGVYDELTKMGVQGIVPAPESTKPLNHHRLNAVPSGVLTGQSKYSWKTYDDTNKKYVTTDPVIDMMDKTYNELRQLHDFPSTYTPPTILVLSPTSKNVPPTTSGAFSAEKNLLGVRPGAKQSTYIHELGHALDRLYMKHNTSVIGLGDTLPIQKVFNALEATDTYTQYRQAYENAIATRSPNVDLLFHTKDGKKLVVSSTTKWTKYMLKESEKWARLYEQYHAYKYGRPSVEAPGYLSQKEIAEIAPLLDEVFKAEGWLKSKPSYSTHDILGGEHKSQQDLQLVIPDAIKLMNAPEDVVRKAVAAAYSFSLGSWKIRAHDVLNTPYITDKSHGLLPPGEKFDVVSALNTYIDLMPTYEGEIFRGFSMNTETAHRTIKKTQDTGFWKPRSVSSFTSNSMTGSSFNPSRNVDASYGYIQFIAHIKNNRSGVSIMNVSYYGSGEMEVIVPKTARYQVVNMDWNDTEQFVTLTLEEITDERLATPYTGNVPQLPDIVRRY